MDNSACIELLRGAQLSERSTKKPGGILGVINKSCSAFKSGKAGEKKDEDMLQDLVSKCGSHGSFVTNPSQIGASERNLFGINHYAGSCSYDIASFVEKDSDLLDSAFVTLLRNSSDGFVSKLVSGPSLAAERHSKDEAIIVQAQASSRPLRSPTTIASPDGSAPPSSDEHARLDSSKIYPVTTQLNHTLSEIIASLDRTRIWTISCIRPNDSGSPNSFDKRRVRAQVRSMLIPDVVARRSVEFITDFEQREFCERYVPTMRGSEMERIRQCAASNGWTEGMDYAVGHRSVWLAYNAWKTVEDVVRAAEKEQTRRSGEEFEDEESVLGDDVTDFTHAEGMGHGGYANESRDNLLVARAGSRGSRYQDANHIAPYGNLGMPSPGLGTPAYEDNDAESASEWDKKGQSAGTSPPYGSKEGEMIINAAPQAVEEVPSSRSRRWWLFLVWGFTGWIPSFVLRYVGRMKRPDIRLAWREKVTIFILIFLMNALVIFYIVEFGRLLCPNFDKAWTTTEVAEHTGDSDWWVAVQGQVYDMSNFIHGDHSDISGTASNAANDLEELAGLDMTNYFPPPLVLACPDLVTESSLELTYKNFTAVVPLAMHKSGSLQSVQNTALDNADWYTATFQPKMNNYHKGPLVWDTKNIAAQAADQDIQRYVHWY
jgi:chitin synthase